jgi:hypothetical protein
VIGDIVSSSKSEATVSTLRRSSIRSQLQKKPRSERWQPYGCARASCRDLSNHQQEWPSEGTPHAEQRRNLSAAGHDGRQQPGLVCKGPRQGLPVPGKGPARHTAKGRSATASKRGPEPTAERVVSSSQCLSDWVDEVVCNRMSTCGLVRRHWFSPNPVPWCWRTNGTGTSSEATRRLLRYSPNMGNTTCAHKQAAK